MKLDLSFPLLAMFGLTRGMAGIGLGLLLADRVAHKRRARLGAVLFGIGAASTIPLIATAIRRSRRLETETIRESATAVYPPEAGVVGSRPYMRT
jgi:hypothetical protein